MALTGKIMDFFADKAMTIPAFPRTKVKAISDDNNVGLNVLLDELRDEVESKVDSVNGKTGAVTLSAADVSAATSSHNHSASNITSGALPVARGGTGGTTVVTALEGLGLPKFRTYYFSTSYNMLDTLKNKYSALDNGCCIVYANCGGSYSCVYGYKIDNYAAFVEIWTGDGNLYKYRNLNGTWYETAY